MTVIMAYAQLRALAGVATLAACLTAFAAPAAAQFGSIFDPPRPPASVPSRPSQAQPQQTRPAPLGLPDEMPPEEMDEEAPPPARPPQAARGASPPAMPGGVRTQPLGPPPGASLAPPPQQATVPPGAALPPQPLQRAPGPPAQPANTAPQPGDDVITEMPSQKIANPTAVFSGLDKITGRTISFDVAINETVQFGALQVTPRVCYTRPPTETPNTDAFLEVDEVTLQGEVKRIFTGWMFASSPGLHAIEHPIYDVWLTDCKGGTAAVADTSPSSAPPPAKPAPATKPAPRAQAAPRQPLQQQPQQQPSQQQQQPPAASGWQLAPRR